MDGELNPNTHWEVIFVIYANIHFKINEYGYYKTQTFGLNSSPSQLKPNIS
jgi:hypothetical protein